MDRRAFIGSGVALGATALLPGAVAAQARGSGDAALTAAFDAIMAEQLQTSPQLATQLGLDKGALAAAKGRLDDRSIAERGRSLARSKAAIARVSAIDPKTLSDASRLDREVVLYSLNQRSVGPEKYGIGSPQSPYVLSQLQGAYANVPDFLNSTHTIETQGDVDAYLARVEAFATALDQDSAAQEADAARGYVAPDFALDLALGQMAALRGVAPERTTLAQSVAKRAKAKGLAGDPGAAAARIVGDKVFPALDRQVALVKRLRARTPAGAGAWRLPQGERLYADALRSATTTELSPEEVHRIGREQVAEITAELDAILKAQGLSQGSVGARLTALNARPDQLYANTDAGRAELLAGLNKGVAEMAARLPTMFLDPSKAPLEIRGVPVEIQDGAPNGYYKQAALDGSRPAIYYINLKDTGDWPRYSLPSLSYHEGVPGHHLQISTAQEVPAPLIRKVAFFNAYVEGWALYAEQLADEMGTYAADPLGKAGFLQSFLFRAARLVTDSGIHAKRWSRDQATDYLVEVTGFPRPRSQREVERYCVWPGQATSYKVGHMSWIKARERAKAIAGAKFDIRRFHEILRAGALPLTILEREVERQARAMV